MLSLKLRHATFCFVAAAVALGGCSSSDDFTHLISSKPSRDGKLVAAYVVEDPGLGAGRDLAITLGPKAANPLKSQVVLAWGEDDRPPQYDWLDNGALLIRLPCGMWGDARNSYQLPGSDSITNIYFRPASGCPPTRPGYPPRFHGGGFQP